MTATSQNVSDVAAVLIRAAVAQVRNCVNNRETDGVWMIDALASLEEVAKTLAQHAKATSSSLPSSMSPTTEDRLLRILENPEKHSPGQFYAEMAREIVRLRALNASDDTRDLDWLDRHITIRCVVDVLMGSCEFQLRLDDSERRITEFVKNADDSVPFGIPIRDILRVAWEATP